MKELSIEEKAKAYDKALERAQALYNDKNEIGYANAESVLEEVFPLLKESEDEKTRKRIIALVNAHGQGIYKGDMLAWLENIPYTIDHEKREGFHLGYKAALEKQGESSDKIHYWTEEEIEPIISDYLRGAEHYGGMIGRLRCLKPKSLEKQGTSYTKSDVDDAYLKGISDAKNELEKQGDSPIKWNKNTEGNKPQVNHSVLMKTTHGIAEGEWKGEYWEQYRWAGIVRDSDVLSWMELSDLDKQGEQKPAWSEKDEKEYKYVLKFVDNILNNCGNKKDYEHCKRCYDWLKSLKQRIGGKQ